MAKYDSLYARLVNSELSTVRLTFEEVGQIVGGLPKSATEHRPWWANEADGKHVQARSWIAAGYEVTDVALGSWVVFSRINK